MTNRAQELTIYGFDVLITPQRTNVAIGNPSLNDVFGRYAFNSFISALKSETDQPGIAIAPDGSSWISTSTALESGGAIWVHSGIPENAAKTSAGILLSLAKIETSMLSLFWEKRDMLSSQIQESIESLTMPHIMNLLTATPPQSEINLVEVVASHMKAQYKAKTSQLKQFAEITRQSGATKLSDVILNPSLLA